MLTCWGGLSRNKSVGIRLGKGETISDILQSRADSLSGEGAFETH
jgi:glycerol-3-phosphate dehydrogenase